MTKKLEIPDRQWFHNFRKKIIKDIALDHIANSKARPCPEGIYFYVVQELDDQGFDIAKIGRYLHGYAIRELNDSVKSVFRIAEPDAWKVYQKGYRPEIKTGLKSLDKARSMIVEDFCIDVHNTLKIPGIAMCSAGHFE